MRKREEKKKKTFYVSILSKWREANPAFRNWHFAHLIYKIDGVHHQKWIDFIYEISNYGRHPQFIERISFPPLPFV